MHDFKTVTKKCASTCECSDLYNDTFYDIPICSTRIHDFVLGRIAFIVKAATTQFSRHGAGKAFRETTTRDKLEELVNNDLMSLTTFYIYGRAGMVEMRTLCNQSIQLVAPLPHQMSSFERRTNQADSVRKAIVDHAFLQHNVELSLLRQSTD